MADVLERLKTALADRYSRLSRSQSMHPDVSP